MGTQVKNGYLTYNIKTNQVLQRDHYKWEKTIEFSEIHMKKIAESGLDVHGAAVYEDGKLIGQYGGIRPADIRFIPVPRLLLHWPWGWRWRMVSWISINLFCIIFPIRDRGTFRETDRSVCADYGQEITHHVRSRIAFFKWRR